MAKRARAVNDGASYYDPNHTHPNQTIEENPAAEPQSKPAKRQKKDRPADAATTRPATATATDNGHANGQANGHAVPQRRRKAAVKPSPASDQSDDENGDEEGYQALLKGIKTYTKRDARKAEFFWHPYIARGIYTLLSGQQGTGKTTFLMFLISRAKRALILPGEEPIEQVVIPRLVAAGVDPARHRIIPAGDTLRLPSKKPMLERLVREEGIDLIAADPVDGYIDEGLNDADNGHMRAFLDVFLATVSANNIAAVLVRHPGKAWDNLVAGSRAFLNHPRAILRFVGEHGVRDRGHLHVIKPPYGVFTPPCAYELCGPDGKPKSFALGKTVDPGKALEAIEVPDRMERKKIDIAAEIIVRSLKGKGEVEAREVFSVTEGAKLNPASVYRAADRLGVKQRTTRKDGKVQALWSLPSKS